MPEPFDVVVYLTRAVNRLAGAIERSNEIAERYAPPIEVEEDRGQEEAPGSPV